MEKEAEILDDISGLIRMVRRWERTLDSVQPAGSLSGNRAALVAGALENLEVSIKEDLKDFRIEE